MKPHFFESIKVIGGIAYNLEKHRDRVLRTTRDFFGFCLDIPFEFILQNLIDLTPNFDYSLTYKLKVFYSDKIHSSELQEYISKNISSLKLIESNIDYSYKWSDRSSIDRLYERRGECSDILIVKNGLITDTSYANIVLSKNGTLFTPKSPLLKGTKREHLVTNGLLNEIDISPEELRDYDSYFIINSMLDMSVVDSILF